MSLARPFFLGILTPVLETQSVPTRRQVATPLCIAYGSILILQSLVSFAQFMRKLPLNLVDRGFILNSFLGYSNGLVMGIAILVFNRLVAAEISGEWDREDHRAIRTSDMPAVGMSFFGLYCLVLGIETLKITSLIPAFLGRGSWDGMIANALPGLLLAALGFGMAIHRRIYRLLPGR